MKIYKIGLEFLWELNILYIVLRVFLRKTFF
jgi:hypothetical protein